MGQQIGHAVDPAVHARLQALLSAEPLADTPDLEVEVKATGELEHKADPIVAGASQVLATDEVTGEVRAIVSVTGIKDRVDDIIEPGAYRKSIARQEPIGVWSHDDKTWVARADSYSELLPGDPFLKTLSLRDGSPWPAEAGAVLVDARFNLDTPHGKAAFSDVKFFEGKTSWSIGYRATKSTRNPRTGVRHIKELDWFEFSPVMVGANQHAMTLSVKSLADAHRVDPDDNSGLLDDAEAKTLLTAGELDRYLEVKARSGRPRDGDGDGILNEGRKPGRGRLASNRDHPDVGKKVRVSNVAGAKAGRTGKIVAVKDDGNLVVNFGGDDSITISRNATMPAGEPERGRLGDALDERRDRLDEATERGRARARAEDEADRQKRRDRLDQAAARSRSSMASPSNSDLRRSGPDATPAEVAAGRGAVRGPDDGKVTAVGTVGEEVTIGGVTGVLMGYNATTGKAAVRGPGGLQMVEAGETSEAQIIAELDRVLDGSDLSELEDDNTFNAVVDKMEGRGFNRDAVANTLRRGARRRKDVDLELEEKARQSGDFAACGRCGSAKVSHLGDDGKQPRCADCGFHLALKGLDLLTLDELAEMLELDAKAMPSFIKDKIEKRDGDDSPKKKPHKFAGDGGLCSTCMQPKSAKVHQAKAADDEGKSLPGVCTACGAGGPAALICDVCDDGPVEPLQTKAGRVLSSANGQQILDAYQALGTLLKKAGLLADVPPEQKAPDHLPVDLEELTELLGRGRELKAALSGLEAADLPAVDKQPAQDLAVLLARRQQL